MPGTKSSGRPGGNPDIKKYGFRTDRDEPLRSRLQLRVPDSMKQQLDQQDNWQEFVRQAIYEKLHADCEEPLNITADFLDDCLADYLSSKDVSEQSFETRENLTDEIKNKIRREINRQASSLIISNTMKTKTISQQSPNVVHKPLESGIYTLECLGNYRKQGEQFFLDGITSEGQVRLAFKVDSNFSGTIWKIIYDEAESIYRLICLGKKNGERFLNGVTTEKRLTLVPNHEDIGEDELSGTKWEAYLVPDELHTFRFKCRSLKGEPFFLDGRTSDSTVGLLEQVDVARSGTRWKVEKVSQEVLRKVGFKNLKLKGF